MRLPPSVIVMSLVTAVPFGLAIRDTVKHEGEDVEWDPDGSKAAARAEEQELQRYQDEERAAEQKNEAVTAARKQLLGATPGTPGTALAAFKLGAPPPADEAGVKADADVRVDVDRSATTLSQFSVEVDSDCYSFESEVIVPVWGASDDHAWIDPATQQQAVWNDETCELSFAKVLPLAQWLDRSPTSVVPIALLGQPVAKLGHEVDDLGAATWDGAALEGGRGPTRMQASTKDGKIIGFRVMQQLDHEHAEAVLARLTELYGQPKHDETYDYYDWKNPKIHYETTSTHLILEIGTLPE